MLSFSPEGCDPAPDSVPCLQDDDVHAEGAELLGSCQPSDPCADHDHLEKQQIKFLTHVMMFSFKQKKKVVLEANEPVEPEEMKQAFFVPFL